MAARFAEPVDYRTLYDTEIGDARLQELLDRASRDIASELRAAGIAYDDPDDDYEADLRDVACAMVRRAIGADSTGCDIPFGASQFSQTGGPYTTSATLANPYGDMFMTKSERRKLGLCRARAGFSMPL